MEKPAKVPLTVEPVKKAVQKLIKSKKPSKTPFIVMVVIMTLSLLTSVYLGYQNYQLRKKIKDLNNISDSTFFSDTTDEKDTNFSEMPLESELDDSGKFIDNPNYCFNNNFKIAFILIANKEDEITKVRMETIERIKGTFNRTFYVATRELATMDTSYSTVYLIDDGNFFSTREDGYRYLNFQYVLKKFYEKNPDNFHFVAMYTTSPGSNDMMHHQGIKNQISGNGLDYYNKNVNYIPGTANKLLGFVFMRDIDNYIKYTDDSYLTNGLLHEVGHQWCCYIQPNFDSEKISEKGIIQQGIHWYRGLSSPDKPGSAMNADFWELNEDGVSYDRYKTNHSLIQKYHPFTLYLMGLVEPDSLNDEYNVYNAGVVGKDFNDKNAEFAFTINVQEIIQREGEIKCYNPDTE